MPRSLFISSLLVTALSAFSTTNIQYLYGDFKGATFMDTQAGAKQTLTAEHYRTWGYGSVYVYRLSLCR
jgi:hypothetical protein